MQQQSINNKICDDMYRIFNVTLLSKRQNFQINIEQQYFIRKNLF